MSAEFVLYYRLENYLFFSAFLNQKQIAPDIFTFEILDDSLPHRAISSSFSRQGEGEYKDFAQGSFGLIVMNITIMNTTI
ncbi:hypothetical protein SD81_010650 [Tolypothrix campylonemoides VB511288]|nr:hypothetical protein SD81_010650 [Tolypothrix campylonemoides VB511288]